MIRVLLADDENLIRAAVATLLAMESDLDVVAQAGPADEAVAMARLHEPHVAVLDLQMPGPRRHRGPPRRSGATSRPAPV
jgi:two-component system response regulator DesR